MEREKEADRRVRRTAENSREHHNPHRNLWGLALADHTLNRRAVAVA
jgi:hypothetical protein